MPNDKRKKGCPNKHCVMNANRELQDLKYEYCPMCRTKLIYVCTACFKEIENLGSEHRYCNQCVAEGKTGTVVKVLKNGQKAGGEVLDAAVEGGKKAAKAAAKGGKHIVDGGKKAAVAVAPVAVPVAKMIGEAFIGEFGTVAAKAAKKQGGEVAKKAVKIAVNAMKK